LILLGESERQRTYDAENQIYVTGQQSARTTDSSLDNMVLSSSSAVGVNTAPSLLVTGDVGVSVSMTILGAGVSGRLLACDIDLILCIIGSLSFRFS
jgi:hypothetical protein